jgi:citrate synthase
MAIPDWTWERADDSATAPGRESEAPDRRSLEAASATFAALADPARLEILFALAEREPPLAYSSLRAATSVRDKGRFNYHLRRLRGEFVADRPEGYALTDAGRSLVHTARREGLLDRREG